MPISSNQEEYAPNFFSTQEIPAAYISAEVPISQHTDFLERNINSWTPTPPINSEKITTTSFQILSPENFPYWTSSDTFSFSSTPPQGEITPYWGSINELQANAALGAYSIAPLLRNLTNEPQVAEQTKSPTPIFTSRGTNPHGFFSQGNSFKSSLDHERLAKKHKITGNNQFYK